MKIGSLFSGAGGLDMAVEHVFGGRTVWHCENDSAASKVLAHRWPGVPNLGDITTTDWAAVEPVDILCGGFPCQDVSSAGRRAGIKDGTRSGLWAIFSDVVAALQPPIVIIENVRGLLSGRAHRIMERNDPIVGDNPDGFVLRAAGAVLGDLADLGYDAQWATIAASDVGAPHRRERVFILAADTECIGLQRLENDACGSQSDTGRGDLRIQPDRCGAASTCGTDWQRRPTTDTAGGGRRRTSDTCSEEGARLRARSEGCRGGTATDTTFAERRGTEQQHLGAPAFGAVEPRERFGQSAIGGSADAAVGGAGPVELLPTPCAATRERKPAEVAARIHTRSLGSANLDEVVIRDFHTELLPTPCVADGERGHLNRSGARSGELLLPGVARAYGNGHLLPTPNATPLSSSLDLTCSGDGRDRPNKLGWAVSELLATPQAGSPAAPARDHKGVPADGFNTFCLCRDVVSTEWGKYEPAIRRWETLTRPAPAPTEPNTKGNPRLSAAFSEWLMGWPAGWVTDVPGISRNDALRIIGNGVVPQQAIAALQWLLSVCEVAA